MAETKAVKVLVDGLTFGNAVYAKGQVILEPTEEMLQCAADKRKTDGGELLCKTLSKQDALKAARKADTEGVDEPVVVAPTGEEVPEVVQVDAPTEPAEGDEENEVE